MSTLLRALIVEDNPNDTELLLLELKHGGFQVEYEEVDRPEAYEAALSKRSWDIIFSDHAMPHFSSFQALEIRNRKGLDTPFIILSGTMGEEVAVEAMKAGANDYFVKGKLTRLTVAVNRELLDAKERKARRETQQELEHFIASLTHDLRTPIVGELRVLELLLGDAFGPLTAEQYEVVEGLIQSNHFAQHMVNNILFAYKYKQKNVQLQKILTDLAQYIRTITASMVIQSFLKENQKELIIEPAEDLPAVMIDRNEIQRVLLNLIKNAIDYTPKGGNIVLSIAQQDGQVRVNVQDTGPGVDPQIEPYLFSLYTTSAATQYHQVGMGLGLYLSSQIIEAHGGTIGYERTAEGSLFYFNLPVL